MALQLNYYHSQLGMTIYNAYWRINPKNGLVGGKDEMNYILEIYKNANDAHAGNIEPIKKNVITYIPDLKSAKNFIEQAYDHAKTNICYGCIDV
jgi:hypothetical protein